MSANMHTHTSERAAKLRKESESEPQKQQVRSWGSAACERATSLP